MKPVTISLNPSYHCNLRCEFCYLTKAQLSDKHRIDLEVLDNLLAEVTSHTPIDYVDLYGGEIGLLPTDYYQNLIAVVRQYYRDEINVITNMTMPPDKLLLDDNFWLTVSYDFEAREMSDRVLTNMISSPKSMSVLILASPEVLSMDVERMIVTLNACSVETVEIKPYSKNQANAWDVSHADFEEFVKKWLTAKTPKSFHFINEDRIRSSLKKEYNAFSDDHVYITPAGRFAVLEFDRNDNEIFTGLNSFAEYVEWASAEKSQISPICRNCDYYGHCLTEHYRYVHDLDHSCNGYKRLLDWYKDNGRLED